MKQRIQLSQMRTIIAVFLTVIFTFTSGIAFAEGTVDLQIKKQEIENYLSNDDYERAASAMLDVGTDAVKKMGYSSDWTNALLVTASNCIFRENMNDAMSLWQFAADLNSTQAAFQLGLMYACGYSDDSIFILADQSVAQEFLKEAQRTDGQYDEIIVTPDVVSQFGWREYGKDNRDTARCFFEIAAEKGDPFAELVLVSRYSDQMAYSVMKDYLLDAAEKNYAPAVYYLGLCYEQGGLGLSENLTTAEQMFNQAAQMLIGVEEADDPMIAYTIAQAYRYGDAPFKTDIQKSKEWYIKAAELGDPCGAYQAGMEIFNGEVSGSDAEMYNLFKSAMDAGDADATFQIAIGLLLGDIQSPMSVDDVMKIAADRGSIQAQIYLNSGTIMMFG